MREGGFANGREWKILVCVMALAPLLLTPWVHGDGIGYVAYLRSAIIDRDFSLANEFEYLSTHIVADARGLPGRLLRQSGQTPGLDPRYHTPAPDPVTGRVPSNYSIGPPIAWAPGYLAAHAATQLARADGVERAEAGYGGAYYLAIAMTSLACAAIGLLLTYRFAKVFASGGGSFWAVLTIAGASPLLYYIYIGPSYSHAVSVLTTASFFLYWLRSRDRADAGVWFRWGILAGIMFLVRWNDAVMVIPVLVLEAARLLRGEAASGRRPPGRHAVLCCCGALLGFVLAASPQLAVWQYFHGRPWVRHPVAYVAFSPEGILGTLVSARHGLFTWTPVTLFAVAGLVGFLRRNRQVAGVLIASFFLLVVSNCMVTDWWGGASFGMRRLVGATPLLVVGLAVFFDHVARAEAPRAAGAWARRPTTRRGSGRAKRRTPSSALVAPVFFLVFSAWNLLLLIQYSLGMISHTAHVSVATIAANQPRAVIELVRLVGGVFR